MTRVSRPAEPCPICGRPLQELYRPFCSARCADVDLGHWLTGSYAIPVPHDEDEDELDSSPRLPGHDGRA